MSGSLAVPSRIPWDSIKGHSLEECVYWLLDSLGAKQIDWRVGGTGAGAADGGRDLECLFHVPEPSGDITPQHWWVEAKGRSGTLSASDIKESIHTVSGKAHVDVHLIVTNQRLSNPTKDWIAEWKRSHRRPDVRVWERHDLERLVSNHPEVAVRLFPSALTSEGRREVMTTRFWEYVAFADVPTLRELWRVRGELSWDEKSWIAALASECATGDLTKRPWGSIIPVERLATVYLTGLINGFYLLFRAESAGVRFDPVIEALSHLLMHLIARFDPAVVACVTERFAELQEGFPRIPDKAKRMLIDPIVTTAQFQASDACMTDCARVFGDRMVLTEEEAKTYWRRFRKPAEPDEGAEADETVAKLFFESKTQACNAGLSLSEENHCPMAHWNASDLTLEEKIRAIRPAIIARTGLTPVDLGAAE